MKKKLLIIFILLFFPCILYAETLTDEQKALKETMDAYYARTNKVNYNASLKFYRRPPEDLTSQSFGYLDCINFIVNVYYHTLGVNITNAPNTQAVYVNNYYNKNHKDIIYWHNIGDKVITREEFISKLKVGDIIGYTYEDSVGHVGLVYDFDSKGDPIIMHVTSAGKPVDVIPNKIDYRGKITQPFNYALSSNNEGGVMKCTSNGTDNTCKAFTSVVSNKYMWIIRPTFEENGKKYYYNNKCDYSKTNQGDSSKYKCTFSNKTEYAMTESAKSRLKYSKIYIAKTVDKVNGSVVSEGSTLKYNVYVKNSSSKSKEKS